MGQGGSSPRSSSGRNRSGSTSSAASAALSGVIGNSSNSHANGLLGEGSGSGVGLPALKPKEYLGPDGGFYMPMSGIYPNVIQEWDASTVIDLIDKRRLAPFYRGLQDELEEGDDQSDQAREVEETLDSIGVKPEAEVTGHHGRVGMRSKEPTAHRKAEVAAYLNGTTECPICMMNFPSNMNTARCCSQPICTECLVQIKRQDPDANHLEPEPVACPFCVEADFGVLYEPPVPSQRRDNKGVPTLNPHSSTLPRSSTSASSSSDSMPSPATDTTPKPRRKSVPADTPEVVSIDALHPNFHAKVEAMRATVSRRANRRIVFRRVGDRLIPIGITSSRAGASMGEGSDTPPSGSSSSHGPSSLSPRRIRRNRGNASRGGSSDFALVGQDLEEMMVNEAIRLSLMQTEEENTARNNDQNTQSHSHTPPPSASSPTHIVA